MTTTTELTKNFNTFRILHIVMAVFLFLGVFMMIGLAFLGTFLAQELANDPGMQDFPFDIGLMYVGIGSIGAVVSLAGGILNIGTAKRFAEKRGYGWIMATSILNCLGGVLGIILAVFTIIQINKPGVKELLKGSTPDSDSEAAGYAR